MCLSFQPYRDNTGRCLDEPVPDTEKTVLERSHTLSEFMTDNLGLTYVAVRNCDLERFSIK